MIFGNSKQFDKQFILLFFSIVLLFYTCYKSHIFDFKMHTIEMLVTENKTAIKNINQKKEPKSSYSYDIYTLNFTQSTTALSSVELPNMKYKENFFVDFKSHFQLDKPKKVTFVIWSDDGFNLIIDGSKKLSFVGDRPLAKNSIEIPLKEGKHTFELAYYQGYGYLGVKAQYRIDKEKYLVGEDSIHLLWALQ